MMELQSYGHPTSPDFTGIYKHPISFDTLGIADRFTLKQEGKVKYSGPIPLHAAGRNLDLYVIEAPGVLDYQVYSLQLFDGRRKVGHVDFQQTEDPKKAKCLFEYLGLALSNCTPDSSILQFIKSQSPPEVKMKALEVYNNFKDKHVGALLWALGCGYMETKDVKIIEIIGDIKTSKREGGFYARYGHLTIPTVDYGRKYVVTHLSAEQESLVAKAFGIPL